MRTPSARRIASGAEVQSALVSVTSMGIDLGQSKLMDLVRVFDSRWNYVDSYVMGGADAGIGFDAFLNTDLTDAEMRRPFTK